MDDQVTPLVNQIKGLLEVLAASHREIERLQAESYRAAIELLQGEAYASEDDRIFLDAIDVLTDAANRRASVTDPASREGSVTVAAELGAQLRVPPGFRVVVAATDETGAYVGVWRNTSERDTEAILNAALHGAERVDHADR